MRNNAALLTTVVIAALGSLQFGQTHAQTTPGRIRRWPRKPYSKNTGNGSCESFLNWRRASVTIGTTIDFPTNRQQRWTNAARRVPIFASD